MKLMSLFDGSGGFPLAASLCGIEPVYASEVEPYPIAVTVSRFPNMKHLGDVSRIKGTEIEPVDIITFGSPCQDMSVAGKRAGLKHTAVGDEETTRSGLFMEAIRIIKEMRVKTNGIYPRFAVWENVPGAFSSNRGEDFRLVLEEFIKITEPDAVMPAVPQAGWAYADCISGDGWSIAYRVFDAQHWGVPQRRRRIYLVADFRGECARKILFEHEGVRGYFETGRTPWQGIAADAQKCVGTDDRAGEIPCQQIIIDNIGGQTEYARQSDTAPCLKATHVVYDARGNGDGQTVSTITGDHNNRITDYTCLVVEPAVRCYDIGEARLRTPREYIEKTPTLTARCGTGGNNVPGVVYCLQGNGIDRADTAGCNGKGWRENECYTLNTIDRPAVVYAMQAFGKYAESEKAGALKHRDYKDATNLVLEEKPIILDRAFFNQGKNAKYDPQYYTDGICPTLVARGLAAVQARYLVRRLTPTECARLQGFPDLWGHPDYKENLTDEEFQFWLAVRNTHAAINGKQTKEYTKPQILTWYNKLHTDSSEYKMWGNGIALPNALYVMQGIAAEAEISINLF
ncbi:DNA cytosine methyltransferase [Phascolarctobacterium faecium]|uniref:DNA cytosine methyltransferase n=1 Tax=Phascolarctobacterium faecium TaxID=33025 RepID=UPI00307AB656